MKHCRSVIVKLLNINLSFADAVALGYPRVIQIRKAHSDIASQRKILLLRWRRNSLLFLSPFGPDRRLRYVQTNAILHQGPAVCIQTMSGRSTILICSLVSLVSRLLLCQRLHQKFTQIAIFIVLAK